MAGINLASKYAKTVDERFTRDSQASLVLNNDYEFTGVETVKVFSIPTVPMGDYSRNGSGNRYGNPSNLTRNVQSMTLTKDRSCSFVIDKGDKIQSQMVVDAGKALSRQISEVLVPEYDAYVFRTLAAAATKAGNYSNTAITQKNAYEMLLNAQERMGNKNVPDKGRICLATYKYANYLKQDPSFMKYGDKSQEMLIKGVIGEVDGTKIVKVPASRLPAGAAFILVHPCAAVGPKQLEDYTIHDNPPGISGWQVDMRTIYDCFVLNNKSDAIYYHGSQGVLKVINVTTAAMGAGMTKVLINPDVLENSGNIRYYMTAAEASGLADVTYGTEVDTSAWTQLTGNGAEITPAAGHTILRVVEVGTDGLPVSLGDAIINL